MLSARAAFFLQLRLHNSQKSSTFAPAMNEFLESLKGAWSDEQVTPEMLMTLAQHLYDHHDDPSFQPLDCMLASMSEAETCRLPNCFQLAIALYHAESFRQILLHDCDPNGELKDFEQFPQALRNGCFDSYLQACVSKLQTESAKMNKAVRPFTELMCYRTMLVAENLCYEQFAAQAPNAVIKQLMDYFLMYFSTVIMEKYPSEENFVQMRQIQKQLHTAKSVPAPPQHREYCEYIDREALAKNGHYTLDEFEDMFAKATQGTARQLAAFIKKYEQLKILDFKGHPRTEIYKTLRAHFPQMRQYSYANFDSYY